MRNILAIALAAGFGACLPQAMAQQHDHHVAAPAATQAAPAARYATDAPLRKGMADIRVAVDMLGHGEHGHLDDAQVRALAANVERAIGGIVAECKLAPEADAALHGIIGRLGQGVAALKAAPADMSAVAPMRAAIADYALLFDDDGTEAAPR